ncbi:triphosphoribosyl-dephospho-CoA synthase [uncultured Piscinibacter sp.]|uniref:triphosphoribosyl-dephospho-CoA synthase n=1 Tax=uncultured Piscinibacter sp. TaxID=1131835 RepID=UPI002612814C|nr:triphosphoribosyl-dephospho-CoA synthase [uncultured Piscinibacter sp.]
MTDALIGHARACFLRACWLDVAVRKPGNVSLVSAGHRMQAEQFVASAQAAVDPLFRLGAGVGERIEAAMDATWQAVGCNTNLGILLLCAPIAAAIECAGAVASADSLRAAIEHVLARLDLTDARAAYRAIAQANPGGLGSAPEQDVHAAPTRGLREAMALAASRDSIARQYANGHADLFDVGLAALPHGFVLMAGPAGAPPSDGAVAAVQRVYLGYLRHIPDSHIVRKHGEAVAHTVMTAAQGWNGVAASDRDPAFAAWDESLKAQGVNPGTSADLTVATLLLAGLLGPAWHGK